jgi:hypothetical protein
MGFKAGAELRGFETRQIAHFFEEGAITPAVKLTAKAMARVARANFRKLTKGGGTGKLLRDIRAMPSKFNEQVWIYGVLGNTNPIGGSDAWLRSTGAHAQFFEYGRSAPGKGKRKGQKSQATKARPQPPRPFMRQTIREGQRKLEGVSSAELKRVASKLRRKKIPNTLLKRIKAA